MDSVVLVETYGTVVAGHDQQNVGEFSVESSMQLVHQQSPDPGSASPWIDIQPMQFRLGTKRVEVQESDHLPRLFAHEEPRVRRFVAAFDAPGDRGQVVGLADGGFDGRPINKTRVLCRHRLAPNRSDGVSVAARRAAHEPVSRDQRVHSGDRLFRTVYTPHRSNNYSTGEY